MLGLDEKEAFKILDDYLKSQTNGNIEVQMLSLNPQEYRIKIKKLIYRHKTGGVDAERQMGVEQNWNQAWSKVSDDLEAIK